jgi:hypothetical protein
MLQLVSLSSLPANMKLLQLPYRLLATEEPGRL